MLHLPEIKSTNSWMLDALRQGQELPDGFVVWTTRQTAGRGQVGNSWEAEPDKNISFSVLLRPAFLAPRSQFVISQITALSAYHALRELLLPVRGEAAERLSIKWPNDLYYDHQKLGGILIECGLQGGQLSYAVLGIGINVNQEVWIGDAPNPTSLRLVAGVAFEPEEVKARICQHIQRYYRSLQLNPAGAMASIHEEFCQSLYRRDGYHSYIDVNTLEQFDAQIVAVEPTGRLHLQLPDESVRIYWFKEVKVVLPSGLVRE